MPEPTLMTTALGEYIRTGSPEAFRQIVEAHINAVYSQCRRQLRDADRAEEATQVVFVTLARRARELRSGILLGGWLFNTARFVCARERRTERRRLTHERKAAEMRHETIGHTSASSHDLRADAELLLDDAIAQLSERDRAVILCRFFDGRSLRDVGEQLGVSEDAAKQRVSRAMEKLRAYFARNGLAIPSSAITASLTAAVQPASQGLLDSVISAAIHGHPSIQPIHRVPIAITSAVKSAAAVVVIAGLVAAGIAVSHHTPAENAAAASPLVSLAIPTTAPSSEPLSQSTPEAALRKLSAAIRQDNAYDIDACLFCTDATSADSADTLRAFFLANAAGCRIKQVWSSAFGQPTMKIQGYDFNVFGGISGGFEELIDRTLRDLKPGDVMTDGQTATVRIRVPLKEMASSNQAPWASASLKMRRVGDQWLLDAPSSVRFVIQPARSLSETKVIVLRSFTELTAILHGVTHAIESGQIKTARQAGDQIKLEFGKDLQELHASNVSINVLPADAGRFNQ